MIIMEDYEELNDIAKKVNALIDKEMKRMDIDRAFYNFKLSVDILDESMQKTDEFVLFDDVEPGYCQFCRKLTFYYSEDLHGYLCPECVMKLKDKK